MRSFYTKMDQSNKRFLCENCYKTNGSNEKKEKKLHRQQQQKRRNNNVLLNHESRLKLRTSSLRTIVLFYDSKPVRTEIPTLYNLQSQNCSKLTCAVIGWIACRQLEFPSHWLSSRLSYESTIVRRLKVLDLSILTPLEIRRSKYLFREQIECNVYASYVICWCDNLFFRAVKHARSFY